MMGLKNLRIFCHSHKNRNSPVIPAKAGIQLFQKTLLILSLLFLSLHTTAFAMTSFPIKLEPVKTNLKNQESLERGAKFFATHCMACHSMRYLSHNTIAKKAGITLDKMPLKDQEWWFGSAPPDLSLTGRVHSARWLYTYLYSFYQDPSRQLGSNNLLIRNSNMPNPFVGLQGQQVLIVDAKTLYNGTHGKTPHYFNVLKLEHSGSLTSEQFHESITDLVNFLVYAAEPVKLDRISLGFWVIGFLIILLILSYLLYKEFWKDIK